MLIVGHQTSVSDSVSEVSFECVPFSLVLWLPVILTFSHLAQSSFYQFQPLHTIMPHILIFQEELKFIFSCKLSQSLRCLQL